MVSHPRKRPVQGRPSIDCSYRYGRDTLLALGKAIAPCSYLTPHYVNHEVLDVRNNFSLLERGVAQFDARFTLRALRSISSLRKRLTGEIICEAIISTYPPNNPTARILIRATGLSDNVLSQIANQVSQESNGTKQDKKEPIPEIDVYIAILIQVCSRSRASAVSSEVRVNAGSRYSFMTTKNIASARSFLQVSLIA